MEYTEIENVFHSQANRQQAEGMSAYLRNQFVFLGIPSPMRKEIAKPYLKATLASKAIDWDFVFWCFEKEEREFQYLSIDYLKQGRKYLRKEDIEPLEQLILSKSWWDTVDGINNPTGFLCLKFPQLKEEKVAQWMYAENRWLKRISIIFQLTYRQKTDTDFLAKAILANTETNEFFVNKAIGWALRQYSRTNPDWVSAFLEENVLDKLSVREASKYL